MEGSPEIVHLSFTPPGEPGSYNRALGRLAAWDTRHSHLVVSYGAHPDSAHAIHVNEANLTAVRRLTSRLPGRARRALGSAFFDARREVYARAVMALLRELRPRLVVCYDDYKLGPMLRPTVDWPARLVFAQHGHSYGEAAVPIYSLAAFDTIVVLAASAYQQQRRAAHPYEPSVVVIPNGVDTTTFRPPEDRAEVRKRFSLGPQKIVLLLSRLIPKKGAHILVESWPEVVADHSDALLWIVGAGEEDYEQRLRSNVDALGLRDHVRFEGEVSPEEAVGCYQAADLYALPTLWNEGQPLTVLEAMASGLPAVVSDYPAARELPAGAVRLVEDPNVAGAFARHVSDMLANPGALAVAGRRGREIVQERFGLDRFLGGWVALIDRELELVGHRAGRH